MFNIAGNKYRIVVWINYPYRSLCPVHRHAPAVRQRDYRNTLKAIEGLMAAKRNTPEGDRLDVLVTLVEAWERKHYPFDLPDPVDQISHGSEWAAASRPHSLHWQS